MNAAEAAQFLFVVSHYDGRPVTESVASTWAATLPEVSLSDALEVLPGYFRDHSGLGLERLMPQHVLDAVSMLQWNRLRAAHQGAFAAARTAGLDIEEASDAARVAREAVAASNPVGLALSRR